MCNSIVQGRHPSSSSLLPAMCVNVKAQNQEKDKFGKRIITLGFFLHTLFPPLQGPLKVEYIFYSALLWLGYRIEPSLYNIHYLCAINDRTQML